MMGRAKFELGIIKDMALEYGEKGAVAAGKAIYKGVNKLTAKEAKSTILGEPPKPEPAVFHGRGAGEVAKPEPAVFHGRGAGEVAKPAQTAAKEAKSTIPKPEPAVFHGRGAEAAKGTPSEKATLTKQTITTTPLGTIEQGASTLEKSKDLTATPAVFHGRGAEEASKPAEGDKESGGGFGIGDLLGKGGGLGNIASKGMSVLKVAGRFLGPAAAVAGAGYAGYKAGSYLNEKLGLSDKISSAAMDMFGPKQMDPNAPKSVEEKKADIAKYNETRKAQGLAPVETDAEGNVVRKPKSAETVPAQTPKNAEKAQSAAQAEKAVETMKEDKQQTQHQQIVNAPKTMNNNVGSVGGGSDKVKQSPRNDETSFHRFIHSRASFT